MTSSPLQSHPWGELTIMETGEGKGRREGERDSFGFIVVNRNRKRAEWDQRREEYGDERREKRELIQTTI